MYRSYISNKKTKQKKSSCRYEKIERYAAFVLFRSKFVVLWCTSRWNGSHRSAATIWLHIYLHSARLRTNGAFFTHSGDSHWGEASTLDVYEPFLQASWYITTRHTLTWLYYYDLSMCRPQHTIFYHHNERPQINLTTSRIISLYLVTIVNHRDELIVKK